MYKLEKYRYKLLHAGGLEAVTRTTDPNLTVYEQKKRFKEEYLRVQYGGKKMFGDKAPTAAKMTEIRQKKLKQENSKERNRRYVNIQKHKKKSDWVNYTQDPPEKTEKTEEEQAMLKKIQETRKKLKEEREQKLKEEREQKLKLKEEQEQNKQIDAGSLGEFSVSPQEKIK